jgi:hypothetical protein
VFDVIAIVKTLDSESLIVVVFLVYSFLGLVFGSMTAGFVCSHGEALCMNVTSWEQWNQIPPTRFDKGCINNVEDVFGPRKRWYCYACPVSPWTTETNEDLIEGYPPYRDDGEPVSVENV